MQVDATVQADQRLNSRNWLDEQEVWFDAVDNEKMSPQLGNDTLYNPHAMVYADRNAGARFQNYAEQMQQCFLSRSLELDMSRGL